MSAAITLAFFLPVRERVASFFTYRLVHSPAVGVTRAMVAVDLLRLSAVPVSCPSPLATGSTGWFSRSFEAQDLTPTCIFRRKTY